MNNLAKEQFEKIKERHKKDFNVWSWLLRVLTMSVALAFIIIYLRDHSQKKNQMGSTSNQQTEAEKVESQGAKRPEVTIPVFRSKQK